MDPASVVTAAIAVWEHLPWSKKKSEDKFLSILNTYMHMKFDSDHNEPFKNFQIVLQVKNTIIMGNPPTKEIDAPVLNNDKVITLGNATIKANGTEEHVTLISIKVSEIVSVSLQFP